MCVYVRVCVKISKSHFALTYKEWAKSLHPNNFTSLTINTMETAL